MSEITKLRLFAVALLIGVGVMVKFFYDNETPRPVSYHNKYVVSDNRRP